MFCSESSLGITSKIYVEMLSKQTVKESKLFSSDQLEGGKTEFVFIIPKCRKNPVA